MPLTLASLKAHVKHALGGEPAVIVTDAATTKQQIVNDAGRILMAMAAWRWAEATPTTVDFANGTTSKVLPTDFAEMVACNAGSAGYQAQLTTFDDLLAKRAAGGTNDPANQYWYTIVHPVQAVATDAMGAPRLELYPAASGTVTLNLIYRRAWTDLTADAHYPAMPAAFEPLLIALVRAVARGYEEDALEEYVGAVVGSAMAQALMDRDSRQRPDMNKAPIARGGRS